MNNLIKIDCFLARRQGRKGIKGEILKGAAAGKPGEVIFVDYPTPAAGEDDLLLAPTACGVCTTDVKQVKKGAVDTRFALGHEVVGKITKSSQSQEWKIGQRVAVSPYLPCGNCFFCKRGQEALCSHLYEISISPGGMAEEILIPGELGRRGTFALPDDLADEAAVLAEPLGCVLKGLEDSRFSMGGSLLVIGDGPMGQLASAAGQALGAEQVIMAGATEYRLQLAREYFNVTGVDVTKTDLITEVKRLTENRGADCVLVAVSSGETIADGISCVRPGGSVNAFAGVPDGVEISLDVRRLHYQQYHLTGSSGVTPKHMKMALKLLNNRKIDFSKLLHQLFPSTRQERRSIIWQIGLV